MSAIFGAISWGPQLDPELSARMRHALSHRDAGRTCELVTERCVLGARTRAAEAAASPVLPFVDPASQIVCVADSRIDHREALARELGLACDGALSNEALFVAAYRALGSGCFARILGDFAVALWDPACARLVLARDPLGVRALYYAHTSELFAFASQAKPLFAHPSVTCELDSLRVAQYLAVDFGDHERTFFRQVRRVAPGHVLVFEGARPKLSRYFSLAHVPALSGLSSSEYAARFRELFLDAVRVRMPEQNELGCMLSGGLDSSGVLGALHTLAPGREVACFSARFLDFPEIDEGTYLALHKQRGGIVLHELRADRISPLSQIDRLHDLLDEPFHAPNLFIYDALARLAEQRGARVLLDGLDGDTVVEHGFFLLHQLLHGGRVRRLARELSALKRRTGLSYRAMLRQWMLAPDRERIELWRTRLGFGRVRYLSRELAEHSRFDDYRKRQAEALLRADWDFRALHLRALEAPMMSFYLEVHDKLAAAIGVDHRHPFFDRRLVELCVALPPEQRLHDGWDRVIQRRAFEGFVPDEIRARQSKSVWTQNFQRQLFEQDGQRIRSLIESSHSPLRGACDLDHLRKDLPRLRAGGSPERVVELWCAVTLGLWAERNSVTL